MTRPTTQRLAGGRILADRRELRRRPRGRAACSPPRARGSRSSPAAARRWTVAAEHAPGAARPRRRPHRPRRGRGRRARGRRRARRPGRRRLQRRRRRLRARLEVHPDDFDRTVAVTFTGAVNVIRAALPHLRASRGAVVATGSLMARVPLPTWSSYSAAKHALRGFLNSLAIEEREQRTGVRVAMVHPGPIDTPLFAQASSAHRPQAARRAGRLPARARRPGARRGRRAPAPRGGARRGDPAARPRVRDRAAGRRDGAARRRPLVPQRQGGRAVLPGALWEAPVLPQPAAASPRATASSRRCSSGGGCCRRRRRRCASRATSRSRRAGAPRHGRRARAPGARSVRALRAGLHRATRACDRRGRGRPPCERTCVHLRRARVYSSMTHLFQVRRP